MVSGMKKNAPNDNAEELRLARLEFASALASLSDPDDVERFFEDVFTTAEIRDIALRWRLVQLLNAGVTQREISERLGVSLCKITRGSRILKSEGSVAKKILNAQCRSKEKKQ